MCRLGVFSLFGAAKPGCCCWKVRLIDLDVICRKILAGPGGQQHSVPGCQGARVLDLRLIIEHLNMKSQTQTSVLDGESPSSHDVSSPASRTTETKMLDRREQKGKVSWPTPRVGLDMG
jgi:hypothetical protein